MIQHSRNKCHNGKNDHTVATGSLRVADVLMQNVATLLKIIIVRIIYQCYNFDTDVLFTSNAGILIRLICPIGCKDLS